MTGLVAGIGFRAILSVVAGKVASAGGSALKWLGSLDLVHALLLIAALFGGWQTLGRWSQHRHTVKVEAQLAKCAAVRATDAANYAKAQADATAKNLAQVASDKAARERISNDVSQSYQAQLASLRADLARRLQHPSAQSAPGVTGLPDISAAPSGPDGQALPLPSDELLLAAETELQLNALIDWVDKQAKVDPNRGAK